MKKMTPYILKPNDQIQSLNHIFSCIGPEPSFEVHTLQEYFPAGKYLISYSAQPNWEKYSLKFV